MAQTLDLEMHLKTHISNIYNDLQQSNGYNPEIKLIMGKI